MLVKNVLVAGAFGALTLWASVRRQWPLVLILVLWILYLSL